MESGSDVPNGTETDETSETEGAEHAHEGRRGELAETKDTGEGGRGARDLADRLLPRSDLLGRLLNLGGSLMSAKEFTKQSYSQPWGEQPGWEAQRDEARARAADGPW